MTTPVQPPPIQAIRALSLPAYESEILPNGIPLHIIRGGSEPVMKMEIVFRAGASYEHKPGVAEFAAGLLSEGTQRLTSVQLAEHVESLGATLFTRGGVDTARVRLLTLTRFFPDLIGTVMEVMDSPAFDADELKVYADNKVERLAIDLKKNEVLAYRHLTEIIFGPDHPYGRNHWPADYLAITPDDLHLHHHRHVVPQKAFMLMAGPVGDGEIELIRQTVGRWNPPHTNGTDITPSPEYTPAAGMHVFDGPQKHQAAIRIGRRLFPQSHPDFNGLYVLNTLLGGYFGSRLMTEIRENQGLTYGIYSSVDSFASDGCFYISTEAATENSDKVIASIRREMDRLQQDLIPQAELDMARNYLMGHLMTQIDGSFATMDYIKSMKIEHLDDPSFGVLIDTIQGCTPEMLRALAERYLSPDLWSVIVVK